MNKLYIALVLVTTIISQAYAESRVMPYCQTMKDTEMENLMSNLNSKMYSSQGSHDVKSIFQNMSGEYVAVICRNNHYMPKKKKADVKMNVKPMR